MCDFQLKEEARVEISAGRCMREVTCRCSAAPLKLDPDLELLRTHAHTSLSSTLTEFKHINIARQSSLLAVFRPFHGHVKRSCSSPSGNPAAPQESTQVAASTFQMLAEDRCA